VLFSPREPSAVMRVMMRMIPAMRNQCCRQKEKVRVNRSPTGERVEGGDDIVEGARVFIREIYHSAVLKQSTPAFLKLFFLV